MKKVLLTIIVFLLIPVIFFISINYAQADVDDSKLKKERYENIYAVYDAPDRVHLYYAQRLTLNDITAYCIEPGKPIDTEIYSSTNDWTTTNLDNDTINYIRLIAYYGYDYPNHNTMNYYLATQELIWKKITKRAVYWVEGLDQSGPRVNIDNEKDEILALANNHTKTPSFDNQTIDIYLGRNILIKDTNQVLDNYEIYSSDIDNVTIEDNNLIINTTKIKSNAEINLIKKHYTNKIALIYYSGLNQKLFHSGILDPVVSSSKVNFIINSKVRLTKIDEVSKKTIRVKGIKFKLKNLDTNEYICPNEACFYETDSSGTITTDLLLQGNYQFEEVKNQKIFGYLWNANPLKFTIDENTNFKYEDNSPIIDLIFTNKQATGGFSFYKKGEKPIFKDGEIIYEKINLPNVKFKLYADGDIYSADGTLIYHDQEIIKEFVTTDKKYVEKGMYIGSYCIEEIASSQNHLVNHNPECFDVKYVDQYHDNYSVFFSVQNYLPKGNFELTKIDLTTKSPIKDVKIALYNEQDELLYSGTTDELGHIYLANIPIGKYYYREYAAPKGYVIDTEKHYFQLTEDKETVKETLTNKYISGTFEFIKMDYASGTPLPDTLIEIYNEQDELLYTEKTNEEGKIIIENIPYGQYYYQETKAPEGYILNPTKFFFEINYDNEVVNANMTNEKISVPNTNLNENYLVYGICSFSIILGAISIIYDHKKQK